MLTKLPLVSFLVFVFLNSQGQIPQEKELVQKISLAKNDETQIVALGELAELYSIFRDNKKADSVLEKQMLLAEISQNDELILKTLSGSVIDNIAAWSSKETFDRATAFLQKCLSYAKEKNNTHTLKPSLTLSWPACFKNGSFTTRPWSNPYLRLTFWTESKIR